MTLEVNHWLGDTESFLSLTGATPVEGGESPTRESSREAGNRGGGAVITDTSFEGVY